MAAMKDQADRLQITKFCALQLTIAQNPPAVQNGYTRGREYLG
jgi:hypothetical protein